jgi:NodT family efflux transporter outer membrane factor (OMF) lipoprotein
VSRSWPLILIAAAGLAGCVVGPNYQTPAAPAPPAGAFVSPIAPAASTDQPPPDWWKLYNDPAIDQLVEDALVHNKSLQAAAANLAEARGALALARAPLFPTSTVNAGGQYGVTSTDLLISELQHEKPPPPGWYYTVGLDASYEVDLFGRIRRGVEAAKADVLAQAAAVDASRISVAGETTRAYLNACAYAQELTVAQQSLDVAGQTYDVTVREARDGGASDLDVARAKEAMERVRATLPAFDANRRIALFQLAVLTGRPPEEISAAADACKTPPKLATLLPVGDLRSLFRRRPDVRQAERQLAGDVARIGVATADLFPTISIGANAGAAGVTPSQLFRPSTDTYGIGPLLSWTFPNTLVAQAHIKQAKATAAASYANFQGAVLQALQDVESALTSYNDEIEHNAALVRVRDQSGVAFRLAQSQYNLGRIGYLDLLTAQNDLIGAGADLAASDQALASDQVTLFKALGGGWEQAPAVPLPNAKDYERRK